MIYTKDIVQALKLKGEGTFPHHNTIVEFDLWLHRRQAGYCTIDVGQLTKSLWQKSIRQCDRIFVPADACNGFVVIGIGRGAIVRMGRLKLAGMHWKMGPQK